MFKEFKFKMAVFLYSENNDTELLHLYLTKMMNLNENTLSMAENEKRIF